MERIIEYEPRKAQILTGMHQAKIAAIEEKKGVETLWGLKDKLVVRFEIENGQQPVTVKKRFNRSLHKNSTLYGLIKG